MTIVEELREWEGMPWPNTGDWHIDPPGGETVTQFHARVQKAILMCLSQASHPLISSHGAVGRLLLQFLKIPDRHVDITRAAA